MGQHEREGVLFCHVEKREKGVGQLTDFLISDFRLGDSSRTGLRFWAAGALLFLTFNFQLYGLFCDRNVYNVEF